MKIKTFKFWICIILITIFATAIITDTLAEKTTVRPKKIEQSLWEYMQTAKNDELIPINILLYDVDDNLILEKLEKKIGLDVKLFQDDERFEKEISSKICDALEKALGYDVAHKTNDKSENEGQLGEKINDIQNAKIVIIINHLVLLFLFFAIPFPFINKKGLVAFIYY